MKFLKWLRKPMKWAIYLAVAGCCLVIGINLYMQGTVKKRIVTPEQAAELDKVDCILLLGCGVRDDGSPSGMLNDRLLQGIALYNAGVSDRLLMGASLPRPAAGGAPGAPRACRRQPSTAPARARGLRYWAHES